MMFIELPTKYDIDINEWENANFYNKNKDNEKLRKRLLDASKYYCMYCGRSLLIDGDCIGQLEHSVDKEGNIGQEKDEETFLTHCKYNFSIACPMCNGSCKTTSRKISFLEREKNLSCLGKKCSSKCKEYDSVRKEYIERNHLILQPDGIEKEGTKYKINYNLLGHYLEPSVETDNIEAWLLTMNHIRTFRMNDERFTYSIIDTAAEIVELARGGMIDKDTILGYKRSGHFTNILGEKFVDFLDITFSPERVDDMVDFCEMLVLLDAI